MRRLLPASLACLAGVVVLAAVGLFDDVDHLRRDMWGALAQVYNWVALAGGQSYAEIVAAGDGPASPLDHYWSLAIEEQFYWVWPLVLVVVLRGRGAVAACSSSPRWPRSPPSPRRSSPPSWGPDAAYWATPARLGEILVGALRRRGPAPAPRRRPPLARRAAWLAVAGLGVVVWAAVTWPSGIRPGLRAAGCRCSPWRRPR